MSDISKPTDANSIKKADPAKRKGLVKRVNAKPNLLKADTSAKDGGAKPERVNAKPNLLKADTSAKDGGVKPAASPAPKSVEKRSGAKPRLDKTNSKPTLTKRDLEMIATLINSISSQGGQRKADLCCSSDDTAKRESPKSLLQPLVTATNSPKNPHPVPRETPRSTGDGYCSEDDTEPDGDDSSELEPYSPAFTLHSRRNCYILDCKMVHSTAPVLFLKYRRSPIVWNTSWNTALPKNKSFFENFTNEGTPIVLKGQPTAEQIMQLYMMHPFDISSDAATTRWFTVSNRSADHLVGWAALHYHSLHAYRRIVTGRQQVSKVLFVGYHAGMFAHIKWDCIVGAHTPEVVFLDTNATGYLDAQQTEVEHYLQHAPANDKCAVVMAFCSGYYKSFNDYARAIGRLVNMRNVHSVRHIGYSPSVWDSECYPTVGTPEVYFKMAVMPNGSPGVRCVHADGSEMFSHRMPTEDKPNHEDYDNFRNTIQQTVDFSAFEYSTVVFFPGKPAFQMRTQPVAKENIFSRLSDSKYGSVDIEGVSFPYHLTVVNSTVEQLHKRPVITHVDIDDAVNRNIGRYRVKLVEGDYDRLLIGTRYQVVESLRKLRTDTKFRNRADLRDLRDSPIMIEGVTTLLLTMLLFYLQYLNPYASMFLLLIPIIQGLVNENHLLNRVDRKITMYLRIPDYFSGLVLRSYILPIIFWVFYSPVMQFVVKLIGFLQNVDYVSPFSLSSTLARSALNRHRAKALYASNELNSLTAQYLEAASRNGEARGFRAISAYLQVMKTKLQRSLRIMKWANIVLVIDCILGPLFEEFVRRCGKGANLVLPDPSNQRVVDANGNWQPALVQVVSPFHDIKIQMGVENWLFEATSIMIFIESLFIFSQRDRPIKWRLVDICFRFTHIIFCFMDFHTAVLLHSLFNLTISLSRHEVRPVKKGLLVDNDASLLNELSQLSVINFVQTNKILVHFFVVLSSFVFVVLKDVVGSWFLFALLVFCCSSAILVWFRPLQPAPVLGVCVRDVIPMEEIKPSEAWKVSKKAALECNCSRISNISYFSFLNTNSPVVPVTFNGCEWGKYAAFCLRIGKPSVTRSPDVNQTYIQLVRYVLQQPLTYARGLHEKSEIFSFAKYCRNLKPKRVQQLRMTYLKLKEEGREALYDERRSWWEQFMKLESYPAYVENMAPLDPSVPGYQAQVCNIHRSLLDKYIRPRGIAVMDPFIQVFTSIFAPQIVESVKFVCNSLSWREGTFNIRYVSGMDTHEIGTELMKGGYPYWIDDDASAFEASCVQHIQYGHMMLFKAMGVSDEILEILSFMVDSFKLKSNKKSFKAELVDPKPNGDETKQASGAFNTGSCNSFCHIVITYTAYLVAKRKYPNIRITVFVLGDDGIANVDLDNDYQATEFAVIWNAVARWLGFSFTFHITTDYSKTEFCSSMIIPCECSNYRLFHSEEITWGWGDIPPDQEYVLVPKFGRTLSKAGIVYHSKAAALRCTPQQYMTGKLINYLSIYQASEHMTAYFETLREVYDLHDDSKKIREEEVPDHLIRCKRLMKPSGRFNFADRYGFDVDVEDFRRFARGENVETINQIIKMDCGMMEIPGVITIEPLELEQATEILDEFEFPKFVYEYSHREAQAPAIYTVDGWFQVNKDDA